MRISQESVYSVYTIENQQLKFLHNSLHFLGSVYIFDNQRSKCLHSCVSGGMNLEILPEEMSCQWLAEIYEFSSNEGLGRKRNITLLVAFE
jgi:hypothetical protein